MYGGGLTVDQITRYERCLLTRFKLTYIEFLFKRLENGFFLGTRQFVYKLMSSMYAIHVLSNIFDSRNFQFIREFTIPKIYVLATRKDEQFCRAMLNQLKTHASESIVDFDPEKILSFHSCSPILVGSHATFQ